MKILPQLKNPHLLTHTVKALKSIQPISAPSKTAFREAKNALGETFGTKKAKAAIRAQERNHVDIGAMTGVMDYVMESIDKGAEGLMTSEEAKEFADSNRLIPTFDAAATEPNDVYPLHNIVPEAEWKALSVSAFEATPNEKERLALLPFRYSTYIKQHLHTITSSTQAPKAKKKNLKLLLYISGMLAFRQAVQRKDVDKEKIYEKLQPLPSIVADGLLARFTEQARGSTTYQSTSSTKTNLLTHIFALCLKLDNFATDTEVLAHDLSMKTSECVFIYTLTPFIPPPESTSSDDPCFRINQLFKTLGCKISKISERERTKLGLTDSSAETKRAILTAPVEFPKPRLKRKT
jgi:DNA-directed RNA polymerase I subunit RPA49